MIMVGMSNNPWRALLTAYGIALERRPLLTEMGTSACLWCLGDLATQYVEMKFQQQQQQQKVAASTTTSTALHHQGDNSVVSSTAQPPSHQQHQQTLQQRRQDPEKQQLLPSNQQQQQQQSQQGQHSPSKLKAQKQKESQQHCESDADKALSTVPSSSSTTQKHSSSSGIDWARTMRQTVYASLCWGPFAHYWYRGLDVWTKRLLPNELTMTRHRVLAKLFMEMFLLHPLGLVAYFTIVGSILTFGRYSLSHVYHAQLRADVFFPTWGLEIALWTPLDALNFALVPVRHQLLVVNCGCFIESMFLSYIQQYTSASATTATSSSSASSASVKSTQATEAVSAPVPSPTSTASSTSPSTLPTTSYSTSITTASSDENTSSCSNDSSFNVKWRQFVPGSFLGWGRNKNNSHKKDDHGNLTPRNNNNDNNRHDDHNDDGVEIVKRHNSFSAEDKLGLRRKCLPGTNSFNQGSIGNNNNITNSKSNSNNNGSGSDSTY